MPCMTTIIVDLILKISKKRLLVLFYCQSTFLVGLINRQAISTKLKTYCLIILTVPRKNLTLLTDIDLEN